MKSKLIKKLVFLSAFLVLALLGFWGVRYFTPKADELKLSASHFPERLSSKSEFTQKKDVSPNPSSDVDTPVRPTIETQVPSLMVFDPKKDDILNLRKEVEKAELEEKLAAHKAKIAEYNAQIKMSQKKPSVTKDIGGSKAPDYPEVPPPPRGKDFSSEAIIGFTKMVSLSPEKEAYVELDDKSVVVIHEGDILKGKRVVSIDKNGVILEGGIFLPFGCYISKKEDDKRSERTYVDGGPPSPPISPQGSSITPGLLPGPVMSR